MNDTAAVIDAGIALRERGMEALDALVGRRTEIRMPAAKAALDRIFPDNGLDPVWDVLLECPVFDIGDGWKIVEVDTIRQNRGRKSKGNHTRYALAIAAPCARINCSHQVWLGRLTTADDLGRAMETYDPTTLCHRCQSLHFCDSCAEPMA